MSAAPRRALILIDVQNEYVTGNLPIEYPDVQSSLAHIVRAGEAAVAAGIPIVVVQQSAPETSPLFAKGSPGWQIHPQVAALPCAHYVEKLLPSALAGTDLAEWLKSQGIDTLSVAGYMTQNCNESTIRQAAHEGWAVEFLHDASGAVSYANRAGRATAEQIHKTSCVVLQSRFAAVVSTDDWLAAVVEGKRLAGDNIYVSHRNARLGLTA